MMKQNCVILVLRVNTPELSNQKNDTNSTEIPGDLCKLMGTAQSFITITKELYYLTPRRIPLKILDLPIKIKRQVL